MKKLEIPVIAFFVALIIATSLFLSLKVVSYPAADLSQLTNTTTTLSGTNEEIFTVEEPLRERFEISLFTEEMVCFGIRVEGLRDLRHSGCYGVDTVGKTAEEIFDRIKVRAGEKIAEDKRQEAYEAEKIKLTEEVEALLNPPSVGL